MEDHYLSQSLRDNVNLLGTMLGKTVADFEGKEIFDKIETIRQMAKSSRSGRTYHHQELARFLSTLSNKEMLSVARAFSHFLNLANIADQQRNISREMDEQLSATQKLQDLFKEVAKLGHRKEPVQKCLDELKIELVLTAHPTEISRRSLINKHTEIIELLNSLELKGHTDRERKVIDRRLAELIAQIWLTNDFREHRPTPVDEARWGFAVIESSLWDAVPNFMRRLEYTSKELTGRRFDLEYAPVLFTFWMGGDRDGNPNVTARVTREVLLLSQWKAAELYLLDIKELIDDLSMSACNETIRQQANGTREPYRFILRQLRSLLQNTLTNLEARLDGEDPNPKPELESIDQLWQPLSDCYHSLHDCGMGSIADSKLLDLLRRIKSFGKHLVRLDIRQESDRHTHVLSELTNYLELGDYSRWDEAEKQAFLLKELHSRRPLIPNDWQPADDCREVLDTCREIARHPREAFGVYVISMARAPSDVLVVHLLMKETGCTQPLPVAPLFETLDDLNNAADVTSQLTAMPWYKDISGGKQTVMIGYSDSAKDAGVLAAGWAQYQAQEALLKVCKDQDFDLRLFHGRGGTIGRGGAPAQAALLSQPPGSLKHGLRVTEQGEMIRNKLGMTATAVKSLALYTSAIIQANLDKPPVPLPKWRELMNQLSDLSCSAYRNIVREQPDFVPYFRMATPEQELAKLPLGSRPARRKAGGGIESLRAIPWIFAWSQNRLMLPAWLGAGQALQTLVNQGKKQILEEMCEVWPFFSTRLSMLEMVYAKADVAISAYYDSVLVDEPKAALGVQLREQLLKDIDTILSIRNDDSLMEDLPMMKKSIEFRNTYVDPLNILQADLLRRNRESEDANLEQALMVSIAGISAGLRNTG